jgi:hypothetical protein
MDAAEGVHVPPEVCTAARKHARACSSAGLAVECVGELGHNIGTLKLSVGGVASCLRLYETDIDNKFTLYECHVKRAAEAFAAHGLAPAAYAGGSGWSLEPWLGSTLESSIISEEDMQTLGTALAALHRDVPPSWFEALTAGVLRDFPVLQSPAHLLSLAPHAAARLARGISTGRREVDEGQVRMLADTSNADLLLLWACGDTALAPQHPAARRIVSVHGDAHPRNIVRTAESEKGLIFIDLELACVTQAVHDLALVLHEVAAHSKTTNQQARHFGDTLLCAYLRAGGFAEPDTSELEQLVLDCRIAYFCSLYLRPRNLPFEPGPAAAVVRCVHRFAAQARSDVAMRSSIIAAPHCASFFADTLGAQVHELGGRCKRPDPVPVQASA